MRVLLPFLFSAISIVGANAQNDIEPINAGAANFLTIPSDARVLGMGGAYVASTEGKTAFFGNGAGLLFGENATKNEIAYNYSPWMRNYERGYNLHGLGAQHMLSDRHAIYGGLRHYGYPRLAVINEGTPNDEFIQPSEWALDVGYAQKISYVLAFSATFRYIRSNMGNIEGAKNAEAVALDLGLLYRGKMPWIPGAKWAAGIQLSNFGTKLKYLGEKNDLPTTGKLGGSLYLPFTPDHKITLAVDLGYRLAPSGRQWLGVNSGVEYTLSDFLRLRGGYRHADKDKGEWSYASAGAGFSYWKLRFDFAWLFAEKEAPIHNTLSFSCSCGF